MLVKKSFNRLHGAISLRGGGNHFDPVAGRKDHAFPNRWKVPEQSKRFRNLGFLESDAFPYLDRRTTVIEANYEDFCMHELFEPTSMPPRENRVSPQEITENHCETDDREKGRLLAS